MIGTTLIHIVFLLGFAYVLVKSVDVLIGILKHLVSVTRVGKFGITAFLLAFATSLPELFVGITAALEGNPSLSLGNVLGSNISNLSIVMGGTALVGSSIRVLGDFLRRDMYLSFFAGSLPLLMLVDSRLTRFEGVALVVVYVIFVMTVLKEKTVAVVSEQVEDESMVRRLFSVLHRRHAHRDIIRLFLSVGLLVFSAHMVVQLAESIAFGLGIPILLIGLFLVSLGTTLPELVFAVRSVQSKQVEMVFGNLLGSIVANATLVLGVVAIIEPITLDGGLQPYLLGTLGYVGIFLLFWVFVSTKKRLERWEGVVLLAGYGLFALVEFLRL